MATRGRKKRKRLPGSRVGVRVKPHTRTPRGPNRGKPIVRVDSYARGKPRKNARKRRKRR